MKEGVCCLQFVFRSVGCGKLCRAIYNLLDITVTDPGYALLNDDATYTRSLVFAGEVGLCVRILRKWQQVLSVVSATLMTGGHALVGVRRRTPACLKFSEWRLSCTLLQDQLRQTRRA